MLEDVHNNSTGVLSTKNHETLDSWFILFATSSNDLTRSGIVESQRLSPLMGGTLAVHPSHPSPWTLCDARNRLGWRDVFRAERHCWLRGIQRPTCHSSRILRSWMVWIGWLNDIFMIFHGGMWVSLNCIKLIGGANAKSIYYPIYGLTCWLGDGDIWWNPLRTTS